MNRAQLLYLFLFLLFTSMLGAQSSPFSTGKWAKIATQKQGIYKLTGAQMKSLGFTTPIASSQVQLYNFNGILLNDKVMSVPPMGLVENAIKVEDGGDGFINDTDYILFYSTGNFVWKYDSFLQHSVHVKTTSNDSSYFFLTLGVNGKRVATQNAPTNTNIVREVFNQNNLFEKDSISLLNSGKVFWGNPMGQGVGKQSQISMLINTQGMGSLDRLQCNVHMASTSYQSNAQFDFFCNDQVVHSSLLAPVSGMLFDDIASEIRDSFYTPLSSSWPNKSSLKVNYSSANSSATGWLDYVEVLTKKKIGFWQDSTISFSIDDAFIKGELNICTIQNLDSSIRLWNITNPQNPLNIQVQIGANGIGSFYQQIDSLTQFFGVRQNAFETPILMGEVLNQNTMLVTVIPNYIIVTAPAYLNAAKKYQQFQFAQFGRIVNVINARELYNDFSGGQPTAVAIRNYIKFIFNKSNALNATAPSYLMLLGMGNFNSKMSNLDFELPVYESENSTSILSSYSTDDFFAVLNNDADINNASTIQNIALAVGRIPARSQQEADSVIQKLINYQTLTSGGAWANKVAWIADDGDYNLHLQDAESIVANLQSKEKHWDHQKLYLDLFPAVASTTGNTYPQVENAIKQTAQDGVLMINYTGHGNYLRLAEEAVISQAQFNSWTNATHLPLMVTASCNFAPYDQPNLHPIAWDALMKNGNGIIGLVAANRLVFAYSNKQINDQFVQQLLIADSNGQYNSIGKALQKAKIANWAMGGDHVNAFKFGLIGDPALQLVAPAQKIVVKKINNTDFIGTDTLLSGTKCVIHGQVQKGTLLNYGFNGIVDLTIYDAVKNVKTLANSSTSMSVPIALQENILFKGKATVNKGVFDIQFILPLQTSSLSSPLRVELAAVSDSNAALLVIDSIYVKPNSSVNTGDTVGPQISAFLNDSLFKQGGWAAPNSTLYITLKDSAGIQASGNVLGHDLCIFLDNDPVPTVLNNFYIADINTYQSGKVQFALPNFSEGKHTCIIKAWDLLGNVNTDTLFFEVPQSKQFVVKNAFNFPNPFNNQTRISFETNFVDKELLVTLSLSTMQGNLVGSRSKTIVNKTNNISLDLDLMNDINSELMPGVYICDISIKFENQITHMPIKIIKL